VGAVADLDGWDAEDHAAALAAFVAGCGVARDPALRAACTRARALGAAADAEARRFFERSFRTETLPGEGVLTAYFAPEYPARRTPDAVYSAPVRPRPAAAATAVAASAPEVPAAKPDVIARVLAGLDPDAQDDTVSASGFLRPLASAASLASADRAAIEAAPAPDALAWMRPEDLFFLQIQGSGVLVFPDRSRAKAVYAADNGRPFTAIARPMVSQGLLPPGRASGDGIRGWLAAHAGPQAQAVMQLNARYVFFALLPDDGREPAGAAGMPLPAGRALAVDPARHAYGELYWIDASAPVLTGATKRYRRLAVALDTGAAIRGEVRADLYIGRGGAAGEEAGRVRHTLRLVRLVPVEALASGGERR
jgi:membrane-bound lytic murein transglycosylase A